MLKKWKCRVGTGIGVGSACHIINSAAGVVAVKYDKELVDKTDSENPYKYIPDCLCGMALVKKIYKNGFAVLKSL